MPITAQTVVRRRPDAIAADVAGEVVVMSERGRYYGLDEIGSDIWRRIEQPIEVAQLCTALALEYDADLATIERDVITLLHRFAEQNLLAPSTPAITSLNR